MITLAALAAATTMLGAPNDTPAQHAQRMAWWDHARFGMFIHWGLYSVPAGKWGDKNGYGEWIHEEAQIPLPEYEKFEKQFNPVKFDADAWAKMAKDAGMKYVVITTKHHDGFNLFKSKYSDWSISSTPFNRDVMKELSTAVRKQGLTMGWYHSIMDWHHPDYLPRRSWETDRPTDGADMDRYVQYLRNEVTQLLTDYGPIGVMWFDGEWESTWTPQYGKSLYDLCRKIQPNVIVNNRVSPGRSGMEDAKLQAGDYGTPEQYIPATGLPGQDWETCMTMNGHWGYNAYDTNWKSSRTLIRNLVDICSKGGNYLLNIGPRSDGTFPPEAVTRLHDIGQWMKTNGESIYGTTASEFDSLPWGRSTTKVHGKQTTLYLQVFDWPKDGRLTVPGVGNKPLNAKVLGGAKVKIERSGSDLVIDVPKNAPNQDATVVALTVEGEPVIYKAPTISALTQLVVTPVSVKIQAPKGQSVRYTLDGSTPTGASTTYTKPFLVTKTSKVRAASFKGSQRVSSVVGSDFKKVVPLPAVDDEAKAQGLLREVYNGSWETMPDFDKLTPVSTDVSNGVSIPMDGNKARENVGVRFSGYMGIAADSVYVVELTSDDGGKVWIDGHLVVDNDGLHSAATKVGSIALAAGAHKITVGYFNGTGSAALHLTLQPVGGKAYELKDSAIGHSRNVWASTLR